jgi:hypothetical protein
MVRIDPIAAGFHGGANVAGHLAANDGAHIAHESFGFPQIAPADGLRDRQERIVDLVVEILRP